MILYQSSSSLYPSLPPNQHRIYLWQLARDFQNPGETLVNSHSFQSYCGKHSVRATNGELRQ